MKIGILTCHRVHNYGALLQAYALLFFLKNLKHDVEIIDYWPVYRKGMYKLVNITNVRNSRIFTRILKLPFSILRCVEKYIRYRRFENFIKNFLGMDSAIKFNTGIEIIDNHDMYIYGSDQIWRYYVFEDVVGFDPVYWGKYPYTNGKKITYAASMGNIDIDTQKIYHICENINNFQAISVRESDLQTLIEKYSSSPITHVLDPVFLLKKSEWLKLFNTKLQRKLERKRYILFYNLIPDEESFKLAQIVSKYFSYEIIEIRGSVDPISFSPQHYQTPGPNEFLTLLDGSQFVITSSFHGVAFSIIFGKQFYAVGMKNNATRVKSLLNLLKISDRFLSDLTNVDLEKKIDYLSVEKILDKYVTLSENFLAQETK